MGIGTKLAVLRAMKIVGALFGMAFLLAAQSASAESPWAAQSVVSVLGQVTTPGPKVSAMVTVMMPFGQVAKSPPREDLERSLQSLPNNSFARDLVKEAIRAQGLLDDEALASIRRRSKSSALLPETRIRVMKSDDARASIDPTDDLVRSYGAASLLWEGRLSWRLDRLLYTEEEMGIERALAERREARLKLAHRALEWLHQWALAQNRLKTSEQGSLDFEEAALKANEAELALDMLTATWFGTHVRARNH